MVRGIRRKRFRGEEVDLHQNGASRRRHRAGGISKNVNKGRLWLFSVAAFHVPQILLDSSAISRISSSPMLSTTLLHNPTLRLGIMPLGHRLLHGSC